MIKTIESHILMHSSTKIYELCYSDIIFNYTIYTCMLAKQLNISATGLALQCYAFTQLVLIGKPYDHSRNYKSLSSF